MLTDFFQHGLVDADRRVEVVDGAWSAVELIGNRIELRLAVNRQIGALWQVLADQPIDVLAAASLPRAVRITEVNLDARVGAQLCMPGHLFALVVRQRMAHGFGNAAQLGRKAFQCRCGRGVGQLGQYHQARASLNQHAHGRPVASALDEVAFPVARKRPIVGLGRANMNAQHIGQLTSAVFTPRARYALALRSAQAGDQVLAQLPAGHGVDAVVDGLVRNGAVRVIGPHALECARDLRGRPALRQKVLHDAKEHGVHRQLGTTPWLEALAPCTHTSRAGVVGTSHLRHECRSVLPTGKPLEFAGDGRRRAMQGARNVARRALLVAHHHDRGSLFRGELFVVRSHYRTLLDGCCT